MKYITFLVFILCFITVSCSERSSQVSRSNISFLALGDSYTIGTSVDSTGRWPVQLRDSLNRDGYEIKELKVIATNGWTTDELHTGIASAELRSDYDLVSLLIGVNNQYRGYEIDNYRIEFRELLEHAIDYAGSDTSRVFVLSIPNYGATPFARDRRPDNIREELSAYNNIASGICDEYGVPFINITPISEEALLNPEYIASDSLHPSAKMYSRWVSEALPVVKKILGKQ